MLFAISISGTVCLFLLSLFRTPVSTRESVSLGKQKRIEIAASCLQHSPDPTRTSCGVLPFYTALEKLHVSGAPISPQVLGDASAAKELVGQDHVLTTASRRLALACLSLILRR